MAAPRSGHAASFGSIGSVYSLSNRATARFPVTYGTYTGNHSILFQLDVDPVDVQLGGADVLHDAPEVLDGEPGDVVQEELECTAPTTQVIGEDATACKRKCNSKCEGAQNKSKCVGECRRACDK